MDSHPIEKNLEIGEIDQSNIEEMDNSKRKFREDNEEIEIIYPEEFEKPHIQKQNRKNEDNMENEDNMDSGKNKGKNQI